MKNDFTPYTDKTVTLEFIKRKVCVHYMQCVVAEVGNNTLILDVLDSNGNIKDNRLYYRYSQISDFENKGTHLQFKGEYDGQKFTIKMTEQ